MNDKQRIQSDCNTIQSCLLGAVKRLDRSFNRSPALSRPVKASAKNAKPKTVKPPAIDSVRAKLASE